MGLIDIWKKDKPVIVRSSTGLSGVSRPLEMQLRWLPNNQVVWYSENREELLDKGYLGNHIVFTIMDWKAQKVALAPPLLYERKDERQFKKYKALMQSKTLEGFLRANDIKMKALVEVEGADIMKIFDRPNPFMTWFEFAYGHCIYKDSAGSAYWEAARAGSALDPTIGKIKELYLPPAHHMRIVSGGITKPVDKYFLTTNPEVKIDGKNVHQTRNFDPRYGGSELQFLYGLPRLYPLRKLLQKNNEAIGTEADIMQKKGIRQIVSPKSLPENSDVDYDQFSQTRDAWDKKMNSNGPGSIMINSHELTQITIGFTPEELGLLESGKADKQDFCAAWHMPANLFGWSEQKTYDNLPESRRIALTDAVLPELEAFKGGLNTFLLPSYYGDSSKFYIDYDYDVFPELQEDIDKKIVRMSKSNSFTVNEFRQVQGWGNDPGENSDKILVSGSLKLLENIGLESFPGDPDLIDDIDEEDEPKK
jgi:hypothetical protein